PTSTGPESKPTSPGPETKPTSTGPETKPTSPGPETKPTSPGPETKPTSPGPETKPTSTGPETKPTDDASKTKTTGNRLKAHHTSDESKTRPTSTGPETKPTSEGQKAKPTLVETPSDNVTKSSTALGHSGIDNSIQRANHTTYSGAAVNEHAFRSRAILNADAAYWRNFYDCKLNDWDDNFAKASGNEPADNFTNDFANKCSIIEPFFLAVVDPTYQSFTVRASQHHNWDGLWLLHSNGSASIDGHIHHQYEKHGSAFVVTHENTHTWTPLIPTASHTTLPLTSIPKNNSTGIATSVGTKSTDFPTNSQPTATASDKSASKTHVSKSARPHKTTPAKETAQATVTSIRPTATVPDTDWLPPTIVAEHTSFSFSAPKTTASGTMSQALPTTIPKFISPDGPNKPAPVGTVPIQIGFTYPLNYLFVSANMIAAAQIFKFLPIALADASGISVQKLQISQLVPYNTQSTWGYVTTLAQLNYPATLVDTLQMDLWSPNSAIYTNSDPIVRNLTALINPNIDIHGNINDASSSGGHGNSYYDDPGSRGGYNNNNDAFGSGNNGTQSSKQKATTAGIAIAALGFSAMYGAAMFIVARRYKRKRQSHRRSSSITSSPDSSAMRYNGNGSPALMGGALMSQNASTYGASGARDSQGSGGHSARTANISAPVATENSLGWN
ncbi:hypothetical protein E4U42_003827, partial [Claviceps africana]